MSVAERGLRFRFGCAQDAGEVRDTRIELVNYGPDGQLQGSLLNDQSAPLPRGFLRRAVAEDRPRRGRSSTS